MVSCDASGLSLLGMLSHVHAPATTLPICRARAGMFAVRYGGLAVFAWCRPAALPLPCPALPAQLELPAC